MKNHKYLFLITLLYFALGIVNIHFALLGFICMAIPLFLLFKEKKKTWCQGYCPRASLYTTCAKAKGSSRKTPLFFTKGKMKWIMFAYFCISLLFIIVSTVKVAYGSMQPIYSIRFFFVFPIGAMKQLVEWNHILPWITHLSYRLYSMMLTTTALGLIFALLYKPRTWCTICPIATVSELYIKNS